MGHIGNPHSDRVSVHSCKGVLIAGPTASGKSELAMAVAKKCGGAIINVDSMQVYRELRILTARPSREDEELLPHELYGHVSACDSYSVAAWLEDAGKVLDRCRKNRITPVFAGGTGLYFKGLTEGLSTIPEIVPEIREKIRRYSDRGGTLHSILSERDPEMAARLMPSDTQRIMRALEVLESTGQSLSKWQESRSEPLIDSSRFCCVVLSPSRSWLQQRISVRLEKMVADGAIEEARDLINMGLPDTSPALRAIGVKTLASVAAGEMKLEQAVEQCIIQTRRFAKRQDTWFRNQMQDWRRIDPEGLEVAGFAGEIQKMLNGQV